MKLKVFMLCCVVAAVFSACLVQEDEALINYKVVFNAGYIGGPSKTVTVARNQRITPPAPPLHMSHLFTGWKPVGQSEDWDFDIDTVTGNMSFTAQWVGLTGIGSWVAERKQYDLTIATQKHPITVAVALNLNSDGEPDPENTGQIINDETDWKDLYQGLDLITQYGGLYITLDLRGSEMGSNTTFEFKAPESGEAEIRPFIRGLILPEEADAIKNSTFTAFKKLFTVSGKNVKTIGASAFDNNGDPGCSELAYIDFPNAETLGDHAFRKTPLKVAYFPKVETIGTTCFSDCSALTHAFFPEVISMTESNSCIFSGAEKLGTVYFPKITALSNGNFTDVKVDLIPGIDIVEGGGVDAVTKLLELSASFNDVYRQYKPWQP